jgi:hypothetical protein
MATATKPRDEELRKNLGVKTPAETIKWINALFYGDPGAGKTWLSATAEDHKDTAPILFLDVEGGVTTIRKRKDIDVVTVRSIDEVVKIHGKLRGSPNCGGYGTVVVDSLTELQKLDMRTLMKEVVNKRPDLDEDVPSQREWGISRERMQRIVRGYRDLPINTIFTALAQEERDNAGTIKFVPSLPGKLRQDIPGFLDVVGYMSTDVDDGKIVRKLQFLGTRRVSAKDRTGALGNSLTDPTIPMIWDLINASNK